MCATAIGADEFACGGSELHVSDVLDVFLPQARRSWSVGCQNGLLLVNFSHHQTLVLQLSAPNTSVGEVRGRRPISTGDKFADMLGGALDATRLLMNEQDGRSEQSRPSPSSTEKRGEGSVFSTTPNLFFFIPARPGSRM